MYEQDHTLPASRRPNPLLTVAAWELRRLAVQRRTWGSAATVFLFFVIAIALKHSWGRPVVDGRVGETITIVGTSTIGLPYLIIELLLALFGLILPFVTTDAIARDVSQRLHEVLMATPVPSGAYVWGRYLAILLASLGLSLVMLGAVLITCPLLHLVLPGYPAPDISLIIAVWLLAVVPATILVSSISFALGALWPRLATILKLAVLVSWITLVLMADVLDHGKSWFTAWNPTSYGIVRVNVNQLLQVYQAAASGIADSAQRAQIALAQQMRPLELWPWVLPHLLLLALALILVAATAARFDRFSEILS